LISIGEGFGGLGGLMKVSRKATPQALCYFNRSDQLNQLFGTSEADAYLGFMAWLLALCWLPRTNPGNRLRYRRGTSFPSAIFPDWCLPGLAPKRCRQQCCKVVSGKSLYEFMRALGMKGRSDSPRSDRTRLRNRIKRLLGGGVSLIYTALR